MTLKEFLKRAGVGALMALYHTTKSQFSKSRKKRFEINLSDPRYEALNHKGGYVICGEDVLVARCKDGNILAARRASNKLKEVELEFRDNAYYLDGDIQDSDSVRLLRVKEKGDQVYIYLQNKGIAS